jgi:hypothetical protein
MHALISRILFCICFLISIPSSGQLLTPETVIAGGALIGSAIGIKAANTPRIHKMKFDYSELSIGDQTLTKQRAQPGQIDKFLKKGNGDDFAARMILEVERDLDAGNFRNAYDDLNTMRRSTKIPYEVQDLYRLEADAYSAAAERVKIRERFTKDSLERVQLAERKQAEQDELNRRLTEAAEKRKADSLARLAQLTDPEWTFIGVDPSGDSLFTQTHPIYVTPYIKIWAKNIHTFSDKLKSGKTVIKKINVRVLMEFDCRSTAFRNLAYHSDDAKGGSIISGQIESSELEWKDIVPETVPSMIFRNVCARFNSR